MIDGYGLIVQEYMIDSLIDSLIDLVVERERKGEPEEAQEKGRREGQRVHLHMVVTAAFVSCSIV